MKNPGRLPLLVDRDEILRRFDREVRQHPPPLLGVRYEGLDGIVRAFGTENVVLYASLEGRDVESVIAEQRAFYAARGVVDFEWKVYEHDRPPDLGARLARAGFVPDPAETLLLFDLTAPLPRTPSPGIEIRTLRSEDDFRTMVAVTGAAFGRDHEARLEELRGRLSDPSVVFFLACVEGTPAATGRLELPEGSTFAGIWGGGTDPRFRHRGVYRALVAARAEVARARGYRYLMVEAAPTSRPILERLGFRRYASVAGWRPRPSP